MGAIQFEKLSITMDSLAKMLEKTLGTGELRSRNSEVQSIFQECDILDKDGNRVEAGQGDGVLKGNEIHNFLKKLCSRFNKTVREQGAVKHLTEALYDEEDRLRAEEEGQEKTSFGDRFKNGAKKIAKSLMFWK